MQLLTTRHEKSGPWKGRAGLGIMSVSLMVRKQKANEDMRETPRLSSVL